MATATLLSSLLEHQVIGRDWCLDRETEGCILADDMGLGKTVTACAVMVARPVRTMIVAPLTLLDQWKAEIAKHTTGLRAEVYHGADRRRLWGAAGAAPDVVITNPETVLGDWKAGGAAAAVFYAGFRRLVIDEAHVFRNQKTNIHKAVDTLFAVTERKIFLTGTPVCNSSDDLVALVTLLNIPQFSDRAFWSRARQEKKLKALQEVRARAVLRRTKEELLAAKLPAKEVRVVPLELGCSALYRKAYDRVRAMHIRPVISKIVRLRQCVNELTLLHGAPRVAPEDDDVKRAEAAELSAKLAYIRDTVAAVPEGEKIVIFSEWTTMLDHIAKHITGAVMYHGKLNVAEKRAALARFNEEPAARVLLMSLRSGSCGLNLCVANHVIMTEPYFSPAEEKQAIDRVYRIGQTRAVRVHKLYVPNTIESWILQLHRVKDTVAGAILCDAPADALTEEESARLELFRIYVS